jgi:hypothetical protein
MKTRNYRRRRGNYSLGDSTLKLIERLCANDWLACVGTPITSRLVGYVPDSQTAINSFLSKNWEDVRLEASNQLSVCVFQSDRKRFNTTWNEISYSAEPLLAPAIAALLDAIRIRFNLDELGVREFEYYAKRDFFGACHETEYADIAPPSLRLDIANWYLVGHLPCGYEGEYPTGKLIVY